MCNIFVEIDPQTFACYSTSSGSWDVDLSVMEYIYNRIIIIDASDFSKGHVHVRSLHGTPCNRQI